jgi:hypothetical protein
MIRPVHPVGRGSVPQGHEEIERHRTQPTAIGHRHFRFIEVADIGAVEVVRKRAAIPGVHPPSILENRIDVRTGPEVRVHVAPAVLTRTFLLRV